MSGNMGRRDAATIRTITLASPGGGLARLAAVGLVDATCNAAAPALFPSTMALVALIASFRVGYASSSSLG